MNIFHLFSKTNSFDFNDINSYNIFLILGGEGKKHPRSLKFLEIWFKLNETQKQNSTIIITGKNSFDFYRKKTEAKDILNFLLSYKIPKEKIILEEQAMDTIGNIVFSYEIIINLISKIKKINPNQKININLITEGFHLSRNREIFEDVFSNLIKENKNISTNFISANTKKINLKLYKKLLTYNLFKKFVKQESFTKKECSSFVKRLFQIFNSYGKDDLIHTFIHADIVHFKLNSYEKFREYLFSMPIYNSHYMSSNSYKYQHSIYAYLIKKHLHLE